LLRAEGLPVAPGGVEGSRAEGSRAEDPGLLAQPEEEGAQQIAGVLRQLLSYPGTPQVLSQNFQWVTPLPSGPSSQAQQPTEPQGTVMGLEEFETGIGFGAGSPSTAGNPLAPLSTPATPGTSRPGDLPLTLDRAAVIAAQSMAGLQHSRLSGLQPPATHQPGDQYAWESSPASSEPRSEGSFSRGRGDPRRGKAASKGYYYRESFEPRLFENRRER